MMGSVQATFRAKEKDANNSGSPAVGIEPSREPRRRVAVCFFGLTRSLRWTLPSIERRLLGVLRDSGMQVEVFLHTYDLLEVSGVEVCVWVGRGEREVLHRLLSLLGVDCLSASREFIVYYYC